MRTLIFDLENAPGTAFYWRAKTEWIGPHMVINHPFMLSYAAKWQDGRKILSGVVTPEEAQARDDSRIVAEIADLLREADKVVAHNCDGFDLPILNGRILVNGLEPLGMVQTIDTLKLARKSFSLTHNSLGALADVLGLGTNKLDTSFSLWVDCMEGDERALGKMLRYNKQDVVVLQKVYERLVPHVKGLPRLVDGDFQNERVCVQCAGESIRKDGFYRTNASTFQRWRCNDCGACMRERTALKAKKLDLVPVG